MTPEETAWVAGLLEGEGTFSIANKPAPHATVICAMTDEDVIRKLARIIGAGKIYGPKVAARSTKPYWVWVLGPRASVRQLLLAIVPYMGERRSAKIRTMLELVDALDIRRVLALKPCGTRAKYERGCRCEPCIRARYYHNLRMRARRTARAAS